MLKYPHLLLAVGLILLDQAAKYYVAMHGTVFRNYQFAFSLPVPSQYMYLFYALILGAIVWYMVQHWRNFGPREALAWTLILAGSLSNIGERILNGYVKDFIYILTGVFNFADLYIIAGIILLLLLGRNRVDRMTR